MQTLSRLTTFAAKQWGTTSSLDIDGHRLTFTELDDLVSRTAGGLSALGLQRGDRIVLYLPNSWQWVVSYHAAARLGLVVIPANILLSLAEVSHILADAEAVCLIGPLDRLDAIKGRPRSVITPEGSVDSIAFDSLLLAQPLAPLTLTPNDLLSISYTSGTTGRPKGVMQTHGNVAAAIAHTSTMHVRNSGDRIWSALPFAHVYGNVVLNACLLTGADLVGSSRFEAGEALAGIARHRITLFEGVPTMYYQMLAHPSLASENLSTLTRCTVGGQTMPISMLEAAAARFACPVLELWGMTELAGPAVTHSPYWAVRHGSIGLPFPGTEVKLVDLSDAGREAAAEQPGELMVRGPLVTPGYWKQPGATAEAIDDAGWLATGDIALRDADGYLRIVDRKKDMILTAGYNVYPAELEQAVARHPDVAMVAVTGFPDEEKGEVAHAFVVLRSGTTLSQNALLNYCRQHLAAYKVPRAIHFVDDLPRTSSGKIMRRSLALMQAGPTPPEEKPQ